MAFDLGAALKDVSRLDAGKEQITYLPLANLDGDPKNFYELRNIEELADNISVAGLQQPIRVRAGEQPGRYTIVSGHRRAEAIRQLAKEDPEAWTEVACIIETDDASPALQQLRLIYANANTRQLTNAEISDQAEQVEMLLYQLKEEGYQFPGRMRDHVAQAVGVSKSKLARLKVIRERLIPEFEPVWRAGKMSESTAYTLAQASPERQQLIAAEKVAKLGDIYQWVPEASVSNCLSQMDRARDICQELPCFRGGPCDHAAVREKRAARLGQYEALGCNGCCRDCYDLPRCKSACEYAGDEKKRKIDAIKAERAEEKAATKERQDAVDAENQKKISLAAESYRRADELRQKLGLTSRELVGTWAKYGTDFFTAQYDKYVAGEGLDANTTLMVGGVRLADCLSLVAVAEKLGCSVDYLLGRDVPGPGASRGGWRTGTPEPDAVGTYVVQWRYGDNEDFCMMTDEAQWDGEHWTMFDAPLDAHARIWWWIDKPEGVCDND